MESIAHKVKLRQLQQSDRQHQKDGTGKKRNVRRLSKELYVVLGWYGVLQSAIFATAAQTSIFTCEDWWGPVGIAGIVTIGTLISVLYKLLRMGKQQQQVLLFQTRQNAVWDQIQELIDHGSTCNLDAMADPHHELDPDPDRGLRHCVFSPRGFLTLCFLVCFSMLVIISCITVLCSHCKCLASH